MVGQLASVSLRNALSQASEGWFRGGTLEGVEVYTPYTRSARSGWTVAIGMPADEVDSGAAEIGWIFAAGAIAAILAAILLANGLSRRIALPISSLATSARSIGRGEPVDPPTTAGVREVREVSYVLARAAKNVREREAALQAADRAKDEFIAMLGHELRNPLSALMSAAEILHFDESTDPNRSRAANVVERQVRHMSRLVDDLLDVSRVTTGKVHLELSPVNLAEAVKSVLDTFDAADRLSDHEIDSDLAPLWIRADRSRIEQITSNLLGNALKYTPAGGRVSISVRGTGGSGGEAILEVEDTGSGLEPALAPRIFDSFVQGDHSLDRESGGLGLGLTLVKSLVERHGGTVEAHSEGPRSRSAVHRQTADDRAAGSRPARRRDPGRSDATRTRRILVIEDNDDARETLTAALESLGHDVLSARDGESWPGPDPRAPTRRGADRHRPAPHGRLRDRPSGSGPWRDDVDDYADALRLVALTGYSTGGDTQPGGGRRVRPLAHQAGRDQGTRPDHRGVAGRCRRPDGRVPDPVPVAARRSSRA
jgi:signal transduction histidine kinase